jgi:hypothetical protein
MNNNTLKQIRDLIEDTEELYVVSDVQIENIYEKHPVWEDMIANLWLVKAGMLDTYPGSDWPLGDTVVSKSAAKEYCVQQYWRYQRMATEGQ